MAIPELGIRKLGGKGFIFDGPEKVFSATGDAEPAVFVLGDADEVSEGAGEDEGNEGDEGAAADESALLIHGAEVEHGDADGGEGGDAPGFFVVLLSCSLGNGEFEDAFFPEAEVEDDEDKNIGEEGEVDERVHPVEGFLDALAVRGGGVGFEAALGQAGPVADEEVFAFDRVIGRVF